MFGDLVNIVRASFGSPPGAYWFLAIVSILASTLYFIAQVYLVDRRKVRIYSERIKKWQEKRKKAMKTKSKRLMMEVQKETEVITKMQGEMAKEQMKPFMIFIIPFLLLFSFINEVYGAEPIMQLPFTLPIVGATTSAVWFYILFNVIVSSILNTILKTYEAYKRLK